MPRSWWCAILAAFIGTTAFFVDLSTKIWAFGIVSPEIHWAYTNLLTLTHHRNMGITANLPVPIPVVIVFTCLVLGFAAGLLHQAAKKGDWRWCVLLGLLIGGACGNLYDRVMYGHVRDWILLFGRSAMNLADFFILMGLLGFFWKSEPKRVTTPDVSTSARS